MMLREPTIDEQLIREAKDVGHHQLYRLENPSPAQLYWPDLDIDIDLDALEDPQRFPLEFRR